MLKDSVFLLNSRRHRVIAINFFDFKNHLFLQKLNHTLIIGTFALIIG